MRVTSIQLEIKDRPKKENIAHVMALLNKAPKSDLILLPEIWPVGYFSFDRYQRESEPVDGPTVNTLREKAAELESYILMGSLVESEGDDLFNTSLLLNPEGQIMAKYRKIHLFGHQSEERKLLEPGNEIVVVELPWGKAGISVCYDLRFPEFYRKMLDQDATFFLVSSAWPYIRLDAWILFNRVRAHENLAYLFSCNCAGFNKGIQLAGHSMFVDPFGKVIAEGTEEECIVSTEINPDLTTSARREFPALDNRVFQ